MLSCCVDDNHAMWSGNWTSLMTPRMGRRRFEGACGSKYVGVGNSFRKGNHWDGMNAKRWKEVATMGVMRGMMVVGPKDEPGVL